MCIECHLADIVRSAGENKTLTSLTRPPGYLLLNSSYLRGLVGRACPSPLPVEQQQACIQCDKNIFYVCISWLENIFKSQLKSFIIAKYTLSYLTHLFLVEPQLLQVVWNTDICGVYIQKWKSVNSVRTGYIHTVYFSLICRIQKGNKLLCTDRCSCQRASIKHISFLW